MHSTGKLSGYVGIDPGSSGAIAIVSITGSPLGHIKCADTPHDVAFWLAEQAGKYRLKAVLEFVAARPGQHAGGMFKFARSAGFLEGLLVANVIPYATVPPAKWQKAMQCLTGGDKGVTKAAAQRRWPEIKFTHAIADAYLLAEYCRTH